VSQQELRSHHRHDQTRQDRQQLLLLQHLRNRRLQREREKMNRTKIEYLDLTWNPTAGCSGFGCAIGKNCWAYRIAKRNILKCELCRSFVPHVHFERFDEPLARKKPARIGVSFMGEFFDEGISEWVRARIKMTIEKACWHNFLVLTKQPQNIDLDEPIPENLWVGVSVNRKEDLWRIATLKLTKAKVKVVSFEPLYEDLGRINLEGIDWVIIGAQTHPTFQPKQEWVWNIIFPASTLNIPIFLKNNLNHANPIQKFPKERVAGREGKETR
jgi:protein gp37